MNNFQKPECEIVEVESDNTVLASPGCTTYQGGECKNMDVTCDWL